MPDQRHSQQSSLVINVSQRSDSARSSSPVAEAEHAVSRTPSFSANEKQAPDMVRQAPEDRVEDSYEQPAMVALAALNDEDSQMPNQAPAPSQQADDDGDDLYGLSPKGLVQHESAKAARQSASHDQVCGHQLP